MDILNSIKEGHRKLLAQAGELEGILTGLGGSFGPTAQEEFRQLLRRFIELLASHSKLETTEFFPMLQGHLSEANRWQVRMVEIQDEVILRQACQLYELSSGVSSSVPVERLKEDGTYLVRWVREHVMVEEEHLFPAIQGSLEG
jgi:hemerythrin-like domain-containing protein